MKLNTHHLCLLIQSSDLDFHDKIPLEDPLMEAKAAYDTAMEEARKAVALAELRKMEYKRMVSKYSIIY